MAKFIHSEIIPGLGAEPVGMVRGANSYRITYKGLAVIENRTGAEIVVPASKAINELERVGRTFFGVYVA
jgi:hypothetical protein